MVMNIKVKNMARRVEGMYNAHPFPSRYNIPSGKSDERYKYIYENFLHIPLNGMKEKLFLDAGCGTGDNTWAWRRILDPSTRVIGLDLSRASVNIARQANAAEQSPLFGVNSLLNLGVANESVDFLLCSGVLVAIPDPDRAFKELVRVLKPGGYIVIILYHKYGRAIHGFRRAIIDLLEPEDIDRRAKLGGKLFGGSMERMAQQENTPLEGVLYDQFGLPCESRYSVGDALKWFGQSGLKYNGSWPPVEWSQFGKGFRYSKDFAGLRQTSIGQWLLRLFPDQNILPSGPPDFFTRLSMESLWALKQLQLFAVSARKG